MNLPNKLTIGRIILVIPFILCLSIFENNIYMDLLAGIFFGAAALTDFLDGYIARKKNLITDFGKLMDPLSDKILVLAALIIFVEKGYIWSWMVIIIIAREFLVTGIRIIAASKGEVIPADKIGKYKTTTQMIAIPMIIFTKSDTVYELFQKININLTSIINFNITVSNLLMIIPLILTIWSGVEYIEKSKKHFL